MVCIARIHEAPPIDDGFVPSHWHEGAVQVQDAHVRIRVALEEVERNDVPVRENHSEVTFNIAS